MHSEVVKLTFKSVDDSLVNMLCFQQRLGIAPIRHFSVTGAQLLVDAHTIYWLESKYIIFKINVLFVTLNCNVQWALS